MRIRVGNVPPHLELPNVEVGVVEVTDADRDADACPWGTERRPEVRSRGLYRTRSCAPVSLNQVHARVFHDPATFERTQKGIRLRPS